MVRTTVNTLFFLFYLDFLKHNDARRQNYIFFQILIQKSLSNTVDHESIGIYLYAIYFYFHLRLMWQNI